MTLGERIRSAREAKGMTLEELGKLCNTTRQTINKYESGIVTNIPLDRIEMIALHLGTTPEELLGWGSSSSSSEKVQTITQLLPSASDEQLAQIEKYIRFVLQDK